MLQDLSPQKLERHNSGHKAFQGGPENKRGLGSVGLCKASRISYLLLTFHNKRL